MSPDPKAEQERDEFEYDPPRSIFAATWFRALLVLIVLGVAGAVAVPAALDWMSPPPPPATAASVQLAPLPVAPPAGPEQAAPPAGETGNTDAPVGAVVSAVPPPEPVPPASSTPSRETATAVPAPPAEPRKTETTTAAEPVAKKPVRAPRTVAQASPAASAGVWWVQIGAFKDAQTAQRVAEKLRSESFQVQESTVTRTVPGTRRDTRAPTGGAATEQYDVFVTGMPAPDLTGKLTTKGLASEPSGSGVVVRPSLPLRDAVALSKDLASEGLKVQVRRTGGDAGVSPSAAPASAGGGETLHRVRVGGFGDRSAAAAAMRELEAKGFKGFLARGDS